MRRPLPKTHFFYEFVQLLDNGRISLLKPMVNNLQLIRHTHKFVFFGPPYGDIFDKHSGMIIPKLINETSILNANKKARSLLPVIINTEGAIVFLFFMFAKICLHFTCRIQRRVALYRCS
jgi:hypothetical protein